MPDLKPMLSPASWASPRSVSQDKEDGIEPVARMHVNYPHGKKMRHLEIELDQEDLLIIIGNAADAIRYLRQGS